jgi:hypothetical protein
VGRSRDRWFGVLQRVEGHVSAPCPHNTVAIHPLRPSTAGHPDSWRTAHLAHTYRDRSGMWAGCEAGVMACPEHGAVATVHMEPSSTCEIRGVTDSETGWMYSNDQWAGWGTVGWGFCSMWLDTFLPPPTHPQRSQPVPKAYRFAPPPPQRSQPVTKAHRNC